MKAVEERSGARGAAALEGGRRLLLAARAGDTEQVRALLALGAPLSADWLGTSALHLAAAHAHADTAAVLLRAGVSRDARTKVERTPLHLAAHAGHAAAARTLLQHGAAPDARDLLRMTPLHWAAQRGHAAVAAALLAAGADPRARSKFGKTPLCLARDAATRRLLSDALTQRAAADADGLTLRSNEQMTEEAATAAKFETIEVEEVPPATAAAGAQPAPAQADAAEAQAPQASGAAALLRAHGITLLPADEGGTVLSALQSGRTVALSDAGKLMLKESGGGSRRAGGVVLRATPARSPPARGVKVFTLGAAREDAPAAPAAETAAPARAAPTVKIVMNRANFNKLVATAERAQPAEATAPLLSEDGQPLARVSLSYAAAAEGPQSDSDDSAEGEASGARRVVSVPEQFVRSSSAHYLRAQLLAAHAALARTRGRLRRTRERLRRAQRAPDAPR